MPKMQEPLLRVAALDARAVEGQENVYELSFSSEEPYRRWGTPEVLDHSPGAVDLSRFADGVGTLLFAHGRDPVYGRMPVGRVLRAWVDPAARKCRAQVAIDTGDENGRRLKAKLDGGMLGGVSVGYQVGAWTELRAGEASADGRFTGPMQIASRWTPYEISLEPTPADPTVGVGKSMEQEGVQKQEMAEEKTLDATSQVEAERTRAVKITQLCQQFGQDPQEYLRSGATLDQVREGILDKLGQERGLLPTGAPGVRVTQDEGDRLRRAAVDGLLLRCGVPVAQPAEGAQELRGMSLGRLAAECLTREGVDGAARMGNEELFRRSMTPTGAFAGILGSAAQRIVLAERELAPTTYQLWTSKGSQADFRPTEIYDISQDGELQEIPENGEFTAAKLSEGPVAVRRLITVGKRVDFTRQLFLNDQFDLVARVLRRLTLGYYQGINRSVYSILKKNPTMGDKLALFSAGHGNLGTAAAPSTASFSEARRLMRQQTETGGAAKLNIAPAYILTGAGNETAIEQLLTSTADPAGANAGVANIFRNRMQLVVDAELDLDSGPQPYFFAANPALADTIEVAYLNGNEAPMVESQPAFDVLGMRFRVYGDCGVTLLGYKGLVKNAGKEEA